MLSIEKLIDPGNYIVKASSASGRNGVEAAIRNHLERRLIHSVLNRQLLETMLKNPLKC